MSATSPATKIYLSTTTLPAGGAATALGLGTAISQVVALRVVSCPSDAYILFGASTASAIPVSAGDIKNDLQFSTLYGSSSAGGSIVLEIHGR